VLVNVRLWLVAYSSNRCVNYLVVPARHPTNRNLNFIYPVPTFPGKPPSGLLYTSWLVCQVRPLCNEPPADVVSCAFIYFPCDGLLHPEGGDTARPRVLGEQDKHAQCCEYSTDDCLA
jgi:hypothetical protein